jgi:hypothetical protein
MYLTDNSTGIEFIINRKPNATPIDIDQIALIYPDGVYYYGDFSINTPPTAATAGVLQILFASSNFVTPGIYKVWLMNTNGVHPNGDGVPYNIRHSFIINVVEPKTTYIGNLTI